jgi:hypothetical protein
VVIVGIQKSGEEMVHILNKKSFFFFFFYFSQLNFCSNVSICRISVILV